MRGGPSIKGACHRPEPDGPGEAGHEAPPHHRRAPHAARLLPERGQQTRHRHDGGHPRCHSASAEWSTRATATPSGQAARRQGLRCPTPPPGVPGAGHRPAHRAEGYRKQRETWSASLGRCLIALQTSSRIEWSPPDRGCFRGRPLSTAAPCVSKRSSPCRTRGPVLHRPQDPTRDGSARVPAGTPLSASRQRISVNDFRAPRQRTPHTAVGQGWNGVPARHIACSTTASLRATATAACLNPMRSTRARPHAFRAESCFTRTSRLAAASNK